MNWRDMLNPLKEMVELEKELILPLDKVLSKDKSSFAIKYDEMESLEIFRKDILESGASFIYNNQRYSLSFPTSQLRSAKRWKVLYNRTREMKSCPRCRNKLRMVDNDIGYCAKCQMSYTINLYDLRLDFQNERIAKISFKNKSTGALLAVCGTIFFIATYYTFYLLSQTEGFSFSDSMNWIGDMSVPFGVVVPCFFIFPLFILITGILVYSGSNSGRIMFGILCILFGLACYFVALLLILSDEEGAWAIEIIISGVGTAIIGYGILLIRSSMRKKTQYTQLTR
jgi:ribosomal protein L37AE/L43A